MARLQMLGQRLAPATPKREGGWAAGHRGSATERGYGWAWQKLRAQVLKRDGGICRCKHCKESGAVRIATEVDHIVPKAQGGTDDLENLQAINTECHARKTAEDSGKRWRPATGLDGWPK